MNNCTLIFDIGKTNKKYLIFDENYNLLFEKDEVFPTIFDEDGFECDDIEKIETWLVETLKSIVNAGEYHISKVNISTYGATLVYLDEQGKRVGPVYNYLKPLENDFASELYEKYGGVNNFSVQTASPALAMLNSGLQIYWLKTQKPEIYEKVKTVLHFPQYLTYLFTGKICSELTSIGCHTAMWNFETNDYHKWLDDLGIELPQPVSCKETVLKDFEGKQIEFGIGIHDSSASLVPFLKSINKKFVLISTGTWSISLNPFNEEPLTSDELINDTLCYMNIYEKPVKASRFFMGKFHDTYNELFIEHFKVDKSIYKTMKADKILIEQSLGKEMLFSEFNDIEKLEVTLNPGQFNNYAEAYHKLMVDLASICARKIRFVLPKENTEALIISGGFSKNEIFIETLQQKFHDKPIYIAEINNSTALGACMVVNNSSTSDNSQVKLSLWKGN